MITVVLMADYTYRRFHKKKGYPFGAPTVRKVPQGFCILN